MSGQRRPRQRKPVINAGHGRGTGPCINVSKCDYGPGSESWALSVRSTLSAFDSLVALATYTPWWQAAGSETVPAMRQEYERGKSFTVTVNRCLRALRFTLTNPQRKSTKSRRYARRYKRSTVSAITGPRLLPPSQYFTFQEPPHTAPGDAVIARAGRARIYVTSGQASRKETSRFWAAVNYTGAARRGDPEADNTVVLRVVIPCYHSRRGELTYTQAKKHAATRARSRPVYPVSERRAVVYRDSLFSQDLVVTNGNRGDKRDDGNCELYRSIAIFNDACSSNIHVVECIEIEADGKVDGSLLRRSMGERHGLGSKERTKERN
ncbi:hypothetical protein DBV15_04350 [Temnothorax longispinosus]|uniref:Uncharacterized protein n=1 Tax=Temnothorax longispinosus TaxID=300112 RepID=A0A4S2K944_9HYME|nr:hypothetical protein DBV15_04350 [Temnothorax longispinosus]